MATGAKNVVELFDDLAVVAVSLNSSNHAPRVERPSNVGLHALSISGDAGLDAVRPIGERLRAPSSAQTMVTILFRELLAGTALIVPAGHREATPRPDLCPKASARRNA